MIKLCAQGTNKHTNNNYQRAKLHFGFSAEDDGLAVETHPDFFTIVVQGALHFIH